MEEFDGTFTAASWDLQRDYTRIVGDFLRGDLNIGINLLEGAIGLFQSGGSGNRINANHDQPVPEPATILLLGLGLISLAAISRRRYIK